MMVYWLKSPWRVPFSVRRTVLMTSKLFMCKCPLLDFCNCPEGTTGNSPAFQRRVTRPESISPEGTAELNAFSRPFGTEQRYHTHPALKRRAIFKRPFGTMY